MANYRSKKSLILVLFSSESVIKYFETVKWNIWKVLLIIFFCYSVIILKAQAEEENDFLPHDARTSFEFGAVSVSRHVLVVWIVEVFAWVLFYS